MRRAEQQGESTHIRQRLPRPLGKTFRMKRRDVRRFMPDPVPSSLIEELLGLAALAPSVGNSQPWQWNLIAYLCVGFLRKYTSTRSSNVTIGRRIF